MLSDALVLAVSTANEREPAWHSLPLGPAGQMRLRIRWDASGHIVTSEVLGSAPAHLQRLRIRTLAALRQGRYRRRSRGEAGEATFHLSVRLEQERPERTSTSDPNSAVAHARRFPTGEEPGSAYFRYPSGRSVRIQIGPANR